MSAVNTQSAKALKSAYFCYFLAALVMLVTAWVIVQGIQATEPASPARNAKVASGVLLLVLEGCAFSLAGLWREFSFVLRTLGWSIFALQLALMTLANYSIGATAGKAAALSTATVAEIRAQADDSRKSAATLRDAAAKLNKSKHGWLNEQGGKVSAEAAQQSAAGAGAVEKLEKMQALTTSTPLVETIGETGLLVLSGAISLVMECAGIALMHVAGSLRRKASSDALPVDVQILELLQRIHGAPAAMPVAMQVEDAASAPALAAPVAPAPASGTPGGLPTSLKYELNPAGTVKVTDASTGLTYFSKPMMAGAGLLAAAAAPTVMAAPAVPTVPASAGASAQSHSGASEQSHSAESQQQQTGASGAAEMPGQSETEQAHPGATAQAHPASPKAGKTDAPKRAWTATAVPDGDKLDSAVSGKGATRYNRVRAAVRSGKLKPSMRAIQLAEGGGGIVVRRYLQQLEADGIIVRAGRGYSLAAKIGGAQ